MPLQPVHELHKSLEESFLRRREEQREEYERHVEEHGDERPTFRRALLHVTPDAFVHMASGRFNVVANVLPRDARIVGAFFNSQRYAFGVVIESEEFEPIREGELMPDLPPPFITRLES